MYIKIHFYNTEPLGPERRSLFYQNDPDQATIDDDLLLPKSLPLEIQEAADAATSF